MSARKLAPVLAVVAVAIAAALVGLTRPRVPQAEWLFGPDQKPVEPFAQVPIYDSLRLRLLLPFEAHVYAVSFAPETGMRAMFPSDYLRSDLSNPLSSGEHLLPGVVDTEKKKTELEWFVPNLADSSISFLLVVSRKERTDLHDALRRCFQIGNTAFPDLSFGSYMPRGGKKVLPPRSKIPHQLLSDLRHNVDASLGPMVQLDDDTWVQAMHIKTTKIRPGQKPRIGPYQKQLQGLEQQIEKKRGG